MASLKAKEVGRDEEKEAAVATQLAQAMEKAGGSPELMEIYHANSEEEMCSADARSQRLSLILRIRNMIGRAFSKQGLLLESFYVLR